MGSEIFFVGQLIVEGVNFRPAKNLPKQFYHLKSRFSLLYDFHMMHPLRD
jgi:hypothetical protein